MGQAVIWVLMLVLGSVQGPPRQHTVHLEADDPVALTVEVLTIDAVGHVTIVASHHLSLNGRAPISFPVSKNHFLRLSYTGVSPHTFAVSDLGLRSVMRAPQVIPGGELFLVASPQLVRPSRLELAGPRSRILPYTGDPLSVPGLTPGNYNITPIYEHGIRGKASQARVRSGESSIVFLPVQPVGAALLRADPEICRGTNEVTLHRRQYIGGGVPARTIVVPIRESCPLSVSGLEAGTYEVFFRAPSAAVLASAVFDVSPQMVTHVPARGAQVKVEGQVFMNGKPLAGATLLFVPTGIAQRGDLPASVETDVAGYYSTWLNEPTEYSVRLRRNGQTLQTKALTLHRGAHRLDWRVQGGTISVVVTGWDGNLAIDGSVSGPTMNQRIGFVRGASQRLLIEGVPPGRYTVAIRARVRRSQTLVKEITLDERSMEAEVVFDLRRR